MYSSFLQTSDFLYVAWRLPQDNLQGPHDAGPQTWWPAKKKPALQQLMMVEREPSSAQQ